VHGGALGARGLADGAGEGRAHGVGELDVRDHAAAEEGADALAVTVDELVGDDDVPGRDLLAQAPDRAHRHDPLDTEALQREDVGAEVDLGGEQAMPAPVPRQEDETRAAEPADDHLVRGRTEGSVDGLALDRVQPG
jgi:hypothetical protein